LWTDWHIQEKIEAKRIEVLFSPLKYPKN